MNYVVLKCGKKVDFSKLKDSVPSTILVSHLHIDVCCRLADTLKFSDELKYKVYVNLLSKHSTFAFQLSALITLHRSGEYNIKKVVSKEIPDTLKLLFEGVEFETASEATPPCYLDRALRKRMFIKALLHRAYRIIGSIIGKKEQCDYTIRSWVEISHKMFSRSYETSNILIYPYFYNFKRHLEYIKFCFANYKNVALSGLPYSIVDSFRISYLNKSQDIELVNFEYNGYRRHAEDLVRITKKEVKTSDEFESGAIVMYDNLGRVGRSVENKSHGINFSCPYICYDRFYVYNESQKSYYDYKSSNVEYIIEERKNSAINDTVTQDDLYRPTVILIHSLFNRVGLKFEHRFQSKVFDETVNICQKLGFPVYIKYHPSSDRSELEELAIWDSVKLIRSLSEMKPCNPIFINLSSASYYDFKGCGPFIFVDDGLVPVRVMFGQEINAIGLSNLYEELSHFKNDTHWIKD